MRLFYIGICSIILLSACKRGLSETEIEKVDHLQTQLKQASIDLAQIDSAKIKAITIQYFEDLDYFKENFTDTVDAEFAHFINQYYGLKEMISFLNESYPIAVKELDVNRAQLQNLKYDAKNGYVEPQHFKQYLELETENEEIIKKTIARIKRTYGKVINAYEKMSPKIDSIIQEDRKEKDNS